MVIDLQDLIGTWRRFGSAGPVHEILGPGEHREDGNLSMRVRVLESGEEVDYRVTQILDDPRER